MNNPELQSSVSKTKKRSYLGPPDPSLVQNQGERNLKIPGFDFHPVVFLTSGGLIVVFVLFTFLFHGAAELAFNTLQSFIATATGWFLLIAATTFLLFVTLIAFTKFGSIRLGGQNARPEFPTSAWLAMLLSAGMGIGLMFWSVAEPISHYQNPPNYQTIIEPGTPAAAKQALGITFFHWGFHAWGIYALVGLSIAFFSYNWGLPLTIRSVFYPILGDRIYGWPGNLVDILAVLSTLFGIATSLGFGVQQVNAGFNFLLGLPVTTGIQIALIAIITGLATASVVSGLGNGVRRLSELNMILAGIFMLFVLAVGPTLFIADSFIETLGYYVTNLPALSFWTESFTGTEWQHQWTIFYWGWWISWSPFVGVFIARVSKGRTVREFVLGVLLLPSFITFVWMTVFGATSLVIDWNSVDNVISQGVAADVSTALFVMLRELPFSGLTSVIGIILVVVFFVTSSDSGSLVVDNLTSGGKLITPTPQRVFWAVLEGVIAGVLLLGGGLAALQTASITTGLPFAIVLLVMCYSVYLGLSYEYNVVVPKQKLEAYEETS